MFHPVIKGKLVDLGYRRPILRLRTAQALRPRQTDSLSDRPTAASECPKASTDCIIFRLADARVRALAGTHATAERVAHRDAQPASQEGPERDPGRNHGPGRGGGGGAHRHERMQLDGTVNTT